MEERGDEEHVTLDIDSLELLNVVLEYEDNNCSSSSPST